MSEADGQCEVCKEPSKQKCSQCKLVYYCSLEHQKENWKDHKAQCIPYEVCSNNELGRFLVAKRDLQPGNVIFVDTPLLVGPRPYKIEGAPPLCVGCCKILLEEIHVCEECGWPACSLECQGLKAPHLHGFECQILKLRPPQQNPEFRFDTLIILRALYLQKTNKKKWDTLLNLEDHLEERGPESAIFETVQEKVSYIQDNYLLPLRAYEESILPEISGDIIHKIYGALDVNATEITESVDLFVLYPTASLLEHNCLPNTIQTIHEKDGYKVTFRAAQPIKSQDHITTTYTNILWGTQERRQHLREMKYFSCVCRRCSDPAELGTNFSALVCLGTDQEPCKGLQLPSKPLEEDPDWICNKCNIKLPNKEICQFVEHLKKEVEKVMEKNPELEELEDFCGKVQIFLHPNHSLVYTIKHSLVQLYRTEGDVELSNDLLSEKLELCQDLIEVTKKIDPANARLALYLAVLLNEQFLAKFKILTRNFNAEDESLSSDLIKEVLEILRENKLVLEYEQSSETGFKLLEVVASNEVRFKKWMEENSIDLNL